MTTTIVPPSAIHRELDAREWRCPLPLLKAKQALQAMMPGETLRVQATDPGSVRDFETWSCLPGGPALLSFAEHEKTFIYLLQKAAA